MNSNLKRFIPLTLLVSAAGYVVAAPAPVSDLNASSQTATSAGPISESSIERLERLLMNRTQVQLQMQQQLDQIAQELSELRGTVERNSYDLSQMLERQRELYRELENVRSQPNTAETASNKKDEKPSGGAYTSNTSENVEYQNAVDLILKEKDYTGAISSFKAFLVKYPKSVYTPNAHYWLGQLFYAQKKDVEAAKDFAAVVAFSDSNKRADALLKLGDIAKRNSNNASAKKYYQQVVDGYPDTTTAQQAKKNLKSL